MPRLLLLAVLFAPLAYADDPTRVLPEGKKPADRRLGKARDLNDKDFILQPPASLSAWNARRQAVREQLLVANGLWPMPAKSQLNPVVHGRIDRDGYSVEKVYFASHPGHYVSGNLYRPRNKDGTLKQGKLPAVLCPHGHWANGRLYDAGDKAAKEQVAIKAEKTMEGAHSPLQARCAQLARMGCVVFFYDMVGYADSTTISHNAFADAEAELRLQNLMGLQTWNSIRALDFLLGLPEVDAKRVGVTGASGGGTQTFILCALDDRPAAAFPAVMVSTQMQGGCVCENTSYLRVGTGNVEFAALFAPKPLAMSGADDWTIEIERKGLPELKAIYKLYDVPDHVAAKCWPMFKHNYNQPAREMMYEWFNKHLGLGHKSPIEEQPFERVPTEDLRVFDARHPRPADSADAKKLREYLTSVNGKQLEALKPADAAGFAEYRRVVGTALRVMLGSSLPEAGDVEGKLEATRLRRDMPILPLLLGCKGQGEEVPALWARGKTFNGTVVVWVDPAGKASLFQDGKLAASAQAILDKGAAILAIDALGTGELTPLKPLDFKKRFAGYTFGYNRPLLSQRCHDILTAVAFARKQDGVKTVYLLGRGKAGPWALLARGLCGDAVARTAADGGRFRFEDVRAAEDEAMLPGALKYGGLAGLVGVSAPGEMLMHNTQGSGSGNWLKAAYKAAGAAEKLVHQGDAMEEGKVVAWLLR